jgi:hypothetical protein
MRGWIDDLLPELRLPIRKMLDSRSRARLARTCHDALAEEDPIVWYFPATWRTAITALAEEYRLDYGTDVSAEAQFLMRTLKELGCADWPGVERTLHRATEVTQGRSPALRLTLYWPHPISAGYTRISVRVTAVPVGASHICKLDAYTRLLLPQTASADWLVGSAVGAALRILREQCEAQAALRV